MDYLAFGIFRIKDGFMIPYLNLGGSSAITHYQIRSDEIRIRFIGNLEYCYRLIDVGVDNFAQMIFLATKGEGLLRFMNRRRRSTIDKAIKIYNN